MSVAAENRTRTRWPKGYLGIDHIVRGGDITVVMETVLFPEVTLGAEMAAKFRKIKPEGWYPVGDLLDLLERLDQKLGTFHVKQVGWTIFRKFHAAKVRAKLPCAHDLLKTLDHVYHEGNRGDSIGGWKILSFTDSSATLEKTSPHHCMVGEGILEEMLATIGVPAQVSQTECFRKGADACRYLIRPTRVSKRWSGN